MSWKLGMTFTTSNIICINPLDVRKADFASLIANSKFHVYLICKRKKLFFESCEKSATENNISQYYYLDDQHEKVRIHISHTNEIEIIEQKNGKTYFKFKGENKELESHTMLNILCHLEGDYLGKSVAHHIPSDLEVMYIGQAFGRNKKRQIDKRLTNHEKLQNIALNIVNNGTLEEVLVIGIEYYVSDLATNLIVGDVDKEQFNLENLIKLRDQARERLPTSQEITVYEAGLISYFRPTLNTEYKETFPSLGYSSYEEIFETDFHYTSVEINTYNTGTRLYSEEIKEPRYIHSNNIVLDSPEKKQEFFSYLFNSD